MGGLHPVVAIYATFLNRAFDQVLMDVAMHRLPVTFVLDRAGVTGPDGASHHGMWDLLDPRRGARPAAGRAAGRGPAGRAAARGGRGQRRADRAAVPHGKLSETDLPAVGKLGRVDVLRPARRGTGEDVLLLGAGSMAAVCAAAAALIADQGIGVTVVDPRWVIPARRGDRRGGRRAPAGGHRRGQRAWPAGSATGWPGCCASSDVETPVRTFGLPQEFLPHGERGQILELCGLTPQHLAREITAAVARRTPALAHEQGA